MKRMIPGTVTLAVVTALALAGCSGGGDGGGGGSDDPIVIGGIAGTTGAYGAVGIAVINGTQMAVDEINEAGGIAGRQIDFKWDDDAADATKSSQLFQQFVSEGAVAILGSPDTGPTTAALGDQMQIPVLGAVDDGGLTVYPNGPDQPPFAWTFSTSLNTFAWGEKIGDWAIANCPGGVATGMKVNNARYRPAKFGGPGEGEVHVGDESAKVTNLAFYTPDAIAPLVLDAVKNNRAFVFDHPDQRKHFRETYSAVVEACYDAADEWHETHGEPAQNATGAKLIVEA